MSAGQSSNCPFSFWAQDGLWPTINSSRLPLDFLRIQFDPSAEQSMFMRFFWARDEIAEGSGT